MKKTTKKSTYQKPRILHQGQLTQFAGSPLGSISTLGLPGMGE